ncbi:MAG TPA: protein kinase, partial [Pirellulales bacterium]
MIQDPRLNPALTVEALRHVEEVCADFEQRWRAGQRPIIEELLGDAEGLNRSALLRELLAIELEYRFLSGERPDLKEYSQRFPPDRELIGLAFEEAQTFASHDLATLNSDAIETQWEEIPTGVLPRPFGDYELLEEIARGGMGVVYRARQRALDRIVAVKMILAGQLASATEVERFRAEAQAAAHLHHPNIVPIIEVGERQGQHFFSMGFVDGKSLAGRLAAGPLPPREAAELLRATAEAVQYAHDCGVIHRDLKPANILLDSAERPHVTDFGLAKRINQDEGLTVTGQIIGTPSFMPPEQAAGKLDAIGPLADVYSLGAVLYATLTGRPPFQAASPIDTLKQVLEREPVAPRSLNPTTPRDLETIALKCLQKEPAKRYPSARTLAEDLQRWLRGEPISARPVGRFERAWRWRRRNPVVAALSGAVALALIMGTVVSTWFAIQSNRYALQADARAKEARDAVDQFFTAVSENQLLDVPGLQPLRKELLGSALAYYQRFIEEHGDDPAVQDELVATYSRVASITSQIGSKEEALSQLEIALRIAERLAREHPKIEEYQSRLLDVLIRVSTLQQELGRLADVEKFAGRAVEVCERFVHDHPDKIEYQETLVNTQETLEEARYALGKPCNPEAAYQRAVDLNLKVVGQYPGDPLCRAALADKYLNLGSFQTRNMQLADAEASWRKSLQIYESLARTEPKGTRFQRGLQDVYQCLGGVQKQTGRQAEAEASCKAALAAAEKIAGDNPTVSDYQRRLADACTNLSSV